MAETIGERLARRQREISGVAGKPGAPTIPQEILGGLLTALSGIAPGRGIMPPLPRINRFTPRVQAQLNDNMHLARAYPPYAEQIASNSRITPQSGIGELSNRTRIRSEPRHGEMGDKGPSDVANAVANHYNIRPVNRQVKPPGIPVTRENLIPMMDRYGLSLSRASGRPGGTQYYTFSDRQGFLPLERLNPQSGRFEHIGNPRHIVRIPDPSDVHAAAERNINDVGSRASAQMGRYYDTSWQPGNTTVLDRNLSLDRFGRTLGDIRNLEGEIVNRHFPAYRRAAGVNPSPRQPIDRLQLNFLDLLDAIKGLK